MSKGWFTLVALFAFSLGLITGGILKGRPELMFIGLGLLVFLYFVRNHLK